MTKETFGIKISTILNATERLNDDLDYLCSLVEEPHPEFAIRDAMAYVGAVSAISNQIDFIVEDLAENDLSEDEEHVKLSKDEVLMLQTYTEATEDALLWLEKTCGISLQSN